MLRKPLSTRLWESASKAIIFGTPVDIAMFPALTKREQEARELLRRGTTEPWVIIKQRIWERDDFVCQVCGLDLEEYPDRLPVGHNIDKVCGGSNRAVNLRPQCVRCNSRKPHHRSLSEYEAWVGNGGVLPGILRAPREEGAA